LKKNPHIFQGKYHLTYWFPFNKILGRRKKINSLTSAVQSSKYKGLKAHRKPSEIKVTFLKGIKFQVGKRFMVLCTLARI